MNHSAPKIGVAFDGHDQISAEEIFPLGISLRPFFEKNFLWTLRDPKTRERVLLILVLRLLTKKLERGKEVNFF